ncbi:sensor histidine kinase [Scytonema sp. PCC 10023]|uniref:sensor histidine kinase n=1 Tax=Scytonema sp. PCC 10023 TaxID=1680591 RepID=UPI0039C5B4C1
MRGPLAQQVKAGLLLALVLLFINSLVSYRNIRRLIENQRSVTHTHEVLTELEQTLSTLKDAETGQRGYLLTGNENYLQPYQRAIAQISTAIDSLTKLTADNPKYEQPLYILQQRITAKLAELELTIKLRREQGFDAAVAVVRTNRGKQLMDNIRQQIADMKALENSLLQQRAKESRASTQQTLVTFSLATAVNLALLALVYYLFRRNQLQSQQEKATLENRVFERTQKLQAANDDLEAFGYTVSHDLQAPLRAMHGFAEALLEDYGALLDELGKEYTRRIILSALRLEDLIQDLLAYSHLNRSELSLKVIDLTQLLSDVINEIQPEIQEKKAEIKIQSPLPQVIGHHSTLVQVITNLLLNAMKFVKVGVRPQVQVCAEKHDNWVRLWVADNGIGIAHEHQQRIFAVFERLHGQETYPGTGIGLAIVRKGVERMQGQVGLESQLGQGSRFWIELRSPDDSSTHNIASRR